jgi:hypothetical protein
MRHLRAVLLPASVLIPLVLGDFAVAGGAGSTSAAFLKLPSGARAIGMGETYTGVGDDVQSIGWNPAGVARMDHRQFTFMHSEWFQGIRYESAAYAQPMGGFLFLGAGLDFLDGGKLDKTTFATSGGLTSGPEYSVIRQGGTFSVTNMVLTVVGAVDVSGLRWLPVPNVQAGINIRMIMEKVDKVSKAGAIMDLGAMWTPPRWANLTLGLVGQNLGPTINGKIPPISFKLGGAYRMMNKNLVLALDYYQPIDNSGRISIGSEYWYRGLICIRGGYRFQGKLDPNEYTPGELNLDTGTESTDAMSRFLKGLSLGAGFRYQIVQVDYAFATLGFLGATHRVSLTVNF